MDLVTSLMLPGIGFVVGVNYASYDLTTEWLKNHPDIDVFWRKKLHEERLKKQNGLLYFLETPGRELAYKVHSKRQT